MGDEVKLLLSDKLARDVLFNIIRNKANSTTQIAVQLGVSHDKVQPLLKKLEKEGLVKSSPLEGVPAEVSALYSITQKGAMTARSLERILNSLSRTTE